MKQCRSCDETDLEKFYKRKDSKDGLTTACKKCTNLKNKKWVQDNKEASAAIKQKYKDSHKDELSIANSEYYKSNKDRINARNTKWRMNNMGKINALTAKRRASKDQRTPQWVLDNKDELKAIAALYTKAREMSEEYGVQYHVDHIIPLNGKLVSGFHCLSNLQVITAKENSEKGNKFTPH